MTAPTVTPTKFKTWIALAGSALAFIVPLLVSVEDYLPAPWPAVIGGIIALLTGLGVYKAPYTPPGTVIAPDTPAVQQAATQAPPVGDTWKNPWT
jgi:hypothetical protein